MPSEFKCGDPNTFLTGDCVLGPGAISCRYNVVDSDGRNRRCTYNSAAEKGARAQAEQVEVPIEQPFQIKLVNPKDGSEEPYLLPRPIEEVLEEGEESPPVVPLRPTHLIPEPKNGDPPSANPEES